MSDVLTPEQRHRCMSKVKSKNTRPEIVVRKFLFSKGFRYRIADKRLPGRANRTSCFRNTAPLSLLTAAFGMGMRGASMHNALHRTPNFGKLKFPVTSSATGALVLTLKSWDGVSLSFGNANSNPKRLRPLLTNLSTN